MNQSVMIRLSQKEPESAHKLYKKFVATAEFRKIYERKKKLHRDQLWKMNSAGKQGTEQTAYLMLTDGLSADTVAKYTGLSVIDVEKLKLKE